MVGRLIWAWPLVGRDLANSTGVMPRAFCAWAQRTEPMRNKLKQTNRVIHFSYLTQKYRASKNGSSAINRGSLTNEGRESAENPEITEQTEKRSKPSENFRLFRYFRIFRTLSSTLHKTHHG